MTTPPFDAAVVIGRFQPFHNGHAGLLARALASAERVVVVLGSARQGRNAKNPFTSDERAAMIRATLSDADNARLSFAPVRDHYDDRRWQKAVVQAVREHVQAPASVALVGYVKDASSDYLQRFPDWSFVAAQRVADVDATGVRQIYFGGEDPAATQALLSGLLPAPVAHYLRGWSHLPAYERLRGEHLAIERSKTIWGSGPFVTVDAVVRASDQVLLVERKHAPGQGLWALPGGFLDGRERVLQGAIRELREETGFGLLDATLEDTLQGVAVFDHPDRSLRGRTITHAHYFNLGDVRPPAVAAADDAAQARWFALAELPAMEEQFFEDHFHILDHFLALTS